MPSQTSRSTSFPELSRDPAYIACVGNGKTHLGDDADVLDLSAERTKKFLRDVRENPFIAVVAYPNGDVCVYDKGLTPEVNTRIKEAVEASLSEGKG